MTSSAFPVAGFVGIAFRQLSLGRGLNLNPARTFDSFLGPKKPLWSQSGLQIRQVLWSRRKSRADTRLAERSVGGGFHVCGNPLSRPKVTTLRSAEQFRQASASRTMTELIWTSLTTVRRATNLRGQRGCSFASLNAAPMGLDMDRAGPAYSGRFAQGLSCCRVSAGWEYLFRPSNLGTLFRGYIRW